MLDRLHFIGLGPLFFLDPGQRFGRGSLWTMTRGTADKLFCRGHFLFKSIFSPLLSCINLFINKN